MVLFSDLIYNIAFRVRRTESALQFEELKNIFKNLYIVYYEVLKFI